MKGDGEHCAEPVQQQVADAGLATEQVLDEFDRQADAEGKQRDNDGDARHRPGDALWQARETQPAQREEQGDMPEIPDQRQATAGHVDAGREKQRGKSDQQYRETQSVHPA